MYPKCFCFRYLDAKLFAYRNRPIHSACRKADTMIWRFMPFLTPIGKS